MLTDLAASNLSLLYNQLAETPLTCCSLPKRPGITSIKRSLPAQITPAKRQRRPMAPSFCFTVQEMRPHTDITDVVDGHGVWHPPQAQGHNVKTGIKQAFRCNGTSIESMPMSKVPLDTSTAVYLSLIHI